MRYCRSSVKLEFNLLKFLEAASNKTKKSAYTDILPQCVLKKTENYGNVLMYTHSWCHRLIHPHTEAFFIHSQSPRQLTHLLTEFT
jgi:hypothetical protein